MIRRRYSGNQSESQPPVVIDERLLPKRFLVVSNRLPYQLDLHGDEIKIKRGIGGLVTALDPILSLTGGVWIGWTGSYEPLPPRVELDPSITGAKSYNLVPVSLEREQVDQYYLGYSNKCLWPLFHYFQEYCEFNKDHWNAYREVNRCFADAVVDAYEEGDLIWVHDYHLMLVPQMVREKLPDARIGFFLHIPFPSSDVFLLEPNAEELLRGVLGSDLIGFHVDAYANNFIDAVSTMTDHRYSRGERAVSVRGRSVKVEAFPISIDYDRFVDLASVPDMDERVASIRNNYRAEILALGVDRLDYSKGILERLRAIEIMLDRYPDMHGRFTFIQISAPSRTKVHAYQEMREAIEGMVGRINGRFGGKGCIPIDYRYQGIAQEDLVAYYRAADVALVTPLRDGMNLVAKEYVVSQIDDGGVLVMSRFAGAYQELEQAVIVNPYDPEMMADRIYEAIVMPEEDRTRRMRRMREIVHRNDIYWWLESFLRELL
jgi:alpha,alpha-trehalose-phosphate synthase [UDP-forming]